MTITRAEFLAEFPEFAGAPVAIVDAKLAEAYRRSPAPVWEDLQDDGAKYLCAHLLALSPFSKELKLVGKTGETSYGIERAKLERSVAHGFRVTGDTSCLG